MTTDPLWLFRATLPLTPEQVAQIVTSRRYPGQTLDRLEQSEVQDFRERLVTLTGSTGAVHEHLSISRGMPTAGWTVQVLLDTAPLWAQVRLADAAFVMLLGIALLARAQDDLVQAGKPPALGRISTALSHEINQPLAAARNYADSAALLIDRAETTRARGNIDRILSLINRMAAIARHLRNVARKPDGPMETPSLAKAVADAVQIADVRLKASGVTVRSDLPDSLPLVLVGPVRLQQVIVNLLSNAAEAMGGTGGEIDLSASECDGQFTLTVRDYGAGVALPIMDRIFEPFFPTKTVGSGLVLRLSISYNILQDFGGDLRVANHPDGGAVFSVVVQAVTARGDAARSL